MAKQSLSMDSMIAQEGIMYTLQGSKTHLRNSIDGGKLISRFLNEAW